MLTLNQLFKTYIPYIAPIFWYRIDLTWLCWKILFKEWKILKIKDIVEIQNCLLSYLFFKEKLPKSFDNFLQRCSNIHPNQTRFSRSECLYMPRFKSVKYGLNCITDVCVNSLKEMFESPFTLSLSDQVKCSTTTFLTINKI